jgi:hypothetical protein
MKSSGIEPATFLHVAQCQLRHLVLLCVAIKRNELLYIHKATNCEFSVSIFIRYHVVFVRSVES